MSTSAHNLRSALGSFAPILTLTHETIDRQSGGRLPGLLPHQSQDNGGDGLVPGQRPR